MKLNEELVIRLVDGSGYYIHMQVGDDNIVPNSENDMYINYTILDRSLYEIDGGEYDFKSSDYEGIDLKSFVPRVIDFIYGHQISWIVEQYGHSDKFKIHEKKVVSENVLKARDIIHKMIKKRTKLIQSIDVCNGDIPFDDIKSVFNDNPEYRLIVNSNKRNIWTAVYIVNCHKIRIPDCISVVSELKERNE